MPEKFFLTTPIYYVNARPHIGHAYTTIVADVLARRHRLLGDDTYFLTGTDEHGQKIERSALAAGVPPQQFADEVSASFQTLWKRMGITNDDFIRTTEPRHQRGAQKLFADLYARGQIYLSSYTGQYSVGEEMFVEGPPGTIGPDSRPTETVTEENFFFRLSQFQLPLLNLIENGPNGEKPILEISPDSRRNEVLSFIRGNTVLDPTRYPELHSVEDLGSTRSTVVTVESLALQTKADVEAGILAYSLAGHLYQPGALRDLSVSRSSFTWGIPVPEPAASQAKEKHVIYVWLDALANYMTALGYGSDDDTLWKKYWPADLHLVGKEIIRFHCVYWPAFLLAAGLPLPRAVTAHGWLLFDDSKMSKSKGNIVRTETILDAFGEQVYRKQMPDSTKAEQDLFAADVLRYFLLREIPFTQDGSFSFQAMVTRYNADLANGYGNLVSRTLTLIHNERASTIPAVPVGSFLCGVPQSIVDVTDDILGTEDIRKQVETLLSTELYLSEFNYFNLGGISLCISFVDRYLSLHKPWKLVKSTNDTDQRKADEALYTAADALRIFTALLYPYIPYATSQVWHQLGLGNIEEAAMRGELKNLQCGGLAPGTKLGVRGVLFPSIKKEAIPEFIQIMADMEQTRNTAQQKLEDSPLTHTTAQADAIISRHTEFSEAPISAPLAEDPTDPAAAPRTASLPEINPGSQVAASAAITTERAASPSHTEAQASGIFAHQPPAGPQDSSPQISIDDFAKVELRVAQVLVAERIPKADKLLRLEVDLGYEKRQILSGIAEWYTPEDLLGRRIVVITNLAPRKMRGLDSHGMLLAASGPDGGKPALATFADTDDLPLGSRLK